MRVVSLCGNIGAGKSTVIDHLGRLCREAGLSATVLPEPVEEWCAPIVGSSRRSMLGLFYEDMARNAMAFQMYVLLSRTNQIRRALVDAPPDALILIERGPWVDLQLMARPSVESGSLSEMDWLVCRRWHDEVLADLLPSLDSAIYIRTKPEECMRRILSRGREAENMDLAYVESVHGSHEAFFEGDEAFLESDKAFLEGDKAFLRASSVASKTATFDNSGSCPSECAQTIFAWLV